MPDRTGIVVMRIMDKLCLVCFSAMGFIQFALRRTNMFGTPLFKKVTLNLENGKQLIINAQIILIKINMSKS
jgi:hypothetical protein